jgi:hypothetical protein
MKNVPIRVLSKNFQVLSHKYIEELDNEIKVNIPLIENTINNSYNNNVKKIYKNP